MRPKRSAISTPGRRRRELEKARGRVYQLGERLAKRDRQLEHLREQLAERDRQLERVRERLAERERRLAEWQARRPPRHCSPAAPADDANAPGLGARPASPSDVAENEALFGPVTYNHDGLAVWAKDDSFLQEPAFRRAHERGAASGHRFRRAGYTLHYGWHTHVACWAAWHAKQLPGSLVECGVNTGNLSLAVCDYIDFNSTGKHFFLFDTFDGIPEEQMAERERAERIAFNREFYEDCFETARRNFAPFPNAHLVRGRVPDTLASVDISEVCYLSIDMNIAEPEIAALEFFWPKLVPGCLVLLDDYGWVNCALQREEMDRFASRRGVKVLAIPTGQGLMVKP